MQKLSEKEMISYETPLFLTWWTTRLIMIKNMIFEPVSLDPNRISP